MWACLTANSVRACSIFNLLVPLKNDDSRWVWKYSFSESKVGLYFSFISNFFVEGVWASFSSILALIDYRSASIMPSWLLFFFLFWREKRDFPQFQFLRRTITIPLVQILRNCFLGDSDRNEEVLSCSFMLQILVSWLHLPFVSYIDNVVSWASWFCKILSSMLSLIGHSEFNSFSRLIFFWWGTLVYAFYLWIDF